MSSSVASAVAPVSAAYLPPMLAGDYARRPKTMGDPLYAPTHVLQAKLDGVRLQVHTGPDGRLAAMFGGRDGTEWTRYKGMAFLRNAAWPADAVLDGELIVAGGTSSDVGHLLLTDPGKLRYVIFDVLRWAGAWVHRWPYAERLGILERWELDLRAVPLPQVQLLIDVARTPGGKDDLVRMVRATGGEGVMLKDLRAPWEPGKRRWTWLKLKFRPTWDVVAVDCAGKPSKWRVRPGQKDTKGKVHPEGVLTDPWKKGWVNLRYGYHDPQTGKLVAVGNTGWTGPREKLEAKVGKVLEVKGYGIYPTGCIRHIQVVRERTDKRPEDCTLADALATGLLLALDTQDQEQEARA